MELYQINTVIWLWVEDGTLYGEVPGGGLVGVGIKYAWSESAVDNSWIQHDINHALILIEEQSPFRLRALYMRYTPPVDFVLVLTCEQAIDISHCREYRHYLMAAPDALAALTGSENANRRYGLAPYLYGLEVIVEEDDP